MTKTKRDDPFPTLGRPSLFTDAPVVPAKADPVATNVATTKSANRRDKAAFNAYQREYTRKRRSAENRDG